jgi:2'-5' RNA ligase
MAMPLAIVLCLDPPGAGEIGRLWQLVDASGLARSAAALGYPPHVTLARCEALDVEATSPLLEAFIAGIAAPRVPMARVGAFREPAHVIWIGPDPLPLLVDMHRALHGLVREPWHPHTEPNAWVPHVTIAITPAEQHEAVGRLVGDAFQPFWCSLARLELVRFPPVEVLGSWALATEAAPKRLH